MKPFRRRRQTGQVNVPIKLLAIVYIPIFLLFALIVGADVSQRRAIQPRVQVAQNEISKLEFIARTNTHITKQDRVSALDLLLKAKQNVSDHHTVDSAECDIAKAGVLLQQK